MLTFGVHLFIYLHYGKSNVNIVQRQPVNPWIFTFVFFSNPESADSISAILAAVEEIEDSLYYFSDVMSSGVPELGRLITNNILRLLVFPLLLPSLEYHACVSIILPSFVSRNAILDSCSSADKSLTLTCISWFVLVCIGSFLRV